MDPRNPQGITDTHPDYDAYVDRWQRARECVGGSDKVKAAGEKYLKMLAGETSREYDARVQRALVYEAADKTVDAFVGALFRKASELELPETVELHLENIDLAGTPYEGFRQSLTEERIEVRRVCVLVDWSVEQKRPFWRTYETEDVRNWRYEVRGGATVLTQVVLREEVSEPSASGFGSTSREQYRVLELDDAGVFQSTVFVLDEGATAVARADATKAGRKANEVREVYREESSITPNRQGVTMSEIPFVCIGRLDGSLAPMKAEILPICDLMLDHYRLSADRKHGLHLTALGGLFVIGDGDPSEAKEYYLGGTRANRLSLGADAKFIGPPSEGQGEIRLEMVADEQRMALTGARMLTAPKREAETAEAMEIQREGESASLSTISYGLSLGLTRCWRFHARWMGLDESKASDTLNRDFTSKAMTPEQVAAQLALVQSGNMSRETFLENLFAAQITREPEEEAARIATQPPEDRPVDAEEELGEEDEPVAEEA